MPTVYPCVPGHEIVGRVTKVGFRRYQVQSRGPAGVGCLVGFRPHLPGVPGGLRAVLPELHAHLQLPDKHHGRGDVRRLL